MIDDERGALNQLVEIFFPMLEQIMVDIAQSSSPNQIMIMHLISKIFFSANNVTNLRSLILSSLAHYLAILFGKPNSHHTMDELFPKCLRHKSWDSI